ncbi:MAG: flagellar assembly peptidoglycan hydrolase FlgJ [Halomonadaceae bacterium]|nr:MAG: flagellar assembly peptidoglycan hydrolase FlgJ [Halomonadaceae bacterium]
MISSSNSDQAKAHIYNDFSGLNQLRGQVDSDPEGALKAVARQFESLFLHEMLKSMRQANAVFAEGNYLQSSEGDFYQDMFDEQLTQSMTQSRSVGIADALVRQLSGEPDRAPRQDGFDVHSSIQSYDRSLPPMSRELPRHLNDVQRIVADEVEQADAAAELPARFDTPEDFVRGLLPLAQEAAAESGISPRLMVAQAALETGWGRHMIEDSDGGASHNLFGIKADSRWSGDRVGIMTTEFRGGVPMRERADFRAYADYQQSFQDYVQFLNDNPRYQNVLAKAHDPDAFARGLREAGYATDPEYDRKIRSIMDGPLLRSALDDAGTGETP